MVIVRFNQWEEFLEELQSSGPDDRTLRLSFSLRYDGQGAPHLTMVAGSLGRDTIVEFIHYLGLQPRERDSSRAKEIQTLFEERRKFLEDRASKVTSRRYHVPPSLHR